jgi:hypothetical protein
MREEIELELQRPKGASRWRGGSNPTSGVSRGGSHPSSSTYDGAEVWDVERRLGRLEEKMTMILTVLGADQSIQPGKRSAATKTMIPLPSSKLEGTPKPVEYVPTEAVVRISRQCCQGTSSLSSPSEI